MPFRQGVKKQLKKVHRTQKLADVSTGLAVLDVDSRWTSRAERGQVSLSPACCSLGLCKCNKVKNLM